MTNSYRPLCPACGQPGEQARIDISEPGEAIPRYTGGQQYCVNPNCDPDAWTQEVSSGWRWRPKTSVFGGLTEAERAYLAMHAIYKAHSWLDLRTHDALQKHPWPERFAHARRWKEIGDWLYPEGAPHQVAALDREAEYY